MRSLAGGRPLAVSAHGRERWHAVWGFVLEGHWPAHESPPLMNSREPNDLLRTPSPDSIMLGIRTWEFGGTVFSPENLAILAFTAKQVVA